MAENSSDETDRREQGRGGRKHLCNKSCMPGRRASALGRFRILISTICWVGKTLVDRTFLCLSKLKKLYGYESDDVKEEIDKMEH